MSGKVIDKRRVMALLDICERTVYRLMNSGVLQPVNTGTRLSFDEEEVLRLKQARLNPARFHKDMIGMLLAKIQALESRMSAVTKILNIRNEPLELTGPEYKNLHRMAEHYSAEGWSPHAEEQWADIFLRFRIEDVEQMAQETGDPHPWRPFLKLASTMFGNTYDPGLRDQLSSGKSNVFQVAGLWCTMHGETIKDFDLIVKRDSAPSKKLLKHLKKTQERVATASTASQAPQSGLWSELLHPVGDV